MILIFFLLSIGCYFGVYRLKQNHAITNLKPALAAFLSGWAGFNFFLSLLIIFDLIEGNSDFASIGLYLSAGITLILCAVNLVICSVFIVGLLMNRVRE